MQIDLAENSKQVSIRTSRDAPGRYRPGGCGECSSALVSSAAVVLLPACLRLCPGAWCSEHLFLGSTKHGCDVSGCETVPLTCPRLLPRVSKRSRLVLDLPEDSPGDEFPQEPRDSSHVSAQHCAPLLPAAMGRPSMPHPRAPGRLETGGDSAFSVCKRSMQPYGRVRMAASSSR